MSKIVRLSDHRERSAHKSFARNAVEVPRDIDGYATIWFRRETNGNFRVNASYYCRNVIDIYSLPEMAASEIRRAIEKG